AVINAVECIGCGLCVTGCPAGAMVLKERGQPPSIPATISEMVMTVLHEKGRLEDFLKVMQG
ncbi:MAG: 4Fe-4S dicluster domain-containing protein, partial [Firmicutes bacterium]|nr:4Fe-4S dicluster domain-containing protein [Bacillota bacterium]